LNNFDQHQRVNLSGKSKLVLRHLKVDYKTYGGQDLRTAMVWVDWIHNNLNNGSFDPKHTDETGVRYSLECCFDWSAKRISVAFLIPLSLSVVVGLWYQRSTGDVQTAWSIASFIVTASAGKNPTSPVRYEKANGLNQRSLLC
jgi:hypothetical protein